MSSELIWVTRSDGAKSCSPGSAQTVESAQRELENAKIRVLKALKANDGKMHAMMCGASSSTVNAYLIPKSELAGAIALGFKPAPGDFQKDSE